MRYVDDVYSIKFDEIVEFIGSLEICTKTLDLVSCRRGSHTGGSGGEVNLLEAQCMKGGGMSKFSPRGPAVQPENIISGEMQGRLRHRQAAKVRFHN